MASCYLDALQDPSGAMRDLEHVLVEAPDYQPALELAERILAAPNTTSTERTNALRYLREHFLRKQQPHEVVRVLELALSLTPNAERRSLLRELVERSVDLREDARAASYQAQLLVLEPLPPDLGKWQADPDSEAGRRATADGKKLEVRFLFEEGGLLSPGKLLRQSRLRDGETNDIVTVLPDEPIKRRRIRQIIS